MLLKNKLLIMTNDELNEFIDQDNLQHSTQQLFEEQQIRTLGTLIELRNELDKLTEKLNKQITFEQAKYFGIY
jgi:hypothetical protein